MNTVQKLRQIVTGLRKAPSNEPEWQLAARLLSRLPADQPAVARACAGHDLDALDAIVSALENPAAAAPASPAQAATFTQQELDAAFRAFRKRLETAQLADESKLGGRQLTGGRKSGIDAIQPPREFPREVWAALVRAGKLKDAGQGFYALA